MPTYTVKAPDGKTITLNGPAGASQADIIAQAQRLYRPNAAPTPAPRPTPRPAAPAAPAQPPEPGSADYYAQRWARLTPVQATALYRKGRQQAIANGQSLDDFHDDPRVQAIQRVAGRQPIVTRQSQVRAAGRAAGQGSSFAQGMTAAVSRGLFSIPEHVAAAARTYVPGLANGNSYSDNIGLVRARDDQMMSDHPAANILGTLGSAFVGGSGAGKLISGGARRAAASAVPAVARGGNILQAVTTVQRGQKAANAGRIALAGAAGGGAQAASEGGNPVTGAAVGAVAGPALAGLGKVGVVLSRPFRDVLRLSTAGQILRRFTTATSEQLSARADAYRQATGAEPTIFELLPLADRNKILKQAVVGRDNVVEQTAGAIRRRAGNLGTEMSARAREIMQPARENIERGITDDMARATGQPAPDVADAETVAAMRSPTDMLALRDREARAIMAPHDGTRAVDNLHDLYPSVPHPTEPGVRVEVDPEVSAVIRGAAGTMTRRAEDAGVNVGEISGIMTKLRPRLGSAVASERETAQRAIDHLHDVLDEATPQAGQAARDMQAAYAARSRMAEGMQEGSRTRLRDDVQVGTSNTQARTNRNAYDSAEGTAGRVLGQGNRVLSDLGGSPEEALRATVAMSRNSTGRQLQQNLGRDEGNALMDAAQAQDESAQAFASASQKVAGGGGDQMGGEALVQALVGLHPGSFITTKAGAMRKLLDMTYIPENRARTIVDMLFSQDPAMTRRALAAIGNGTNGAGYMQYLSGITGQLAGGAQAGDTPPPDIVAPSGGTVDDAPAPEEPAPGEDLGPNDGAMDPTGGEGDPEPVDEGDSPYVSHLQEIYDNENPEMLDLINRVSGQESGGRQHDDQGRPLRSSAGAIGVMQVMPDTAPEAARLAGVPFDRQAYLHDPAYNKLIGIAYLSELLRKYDGDVAKATAAYNAGSGRLAAAERAHGANWLAHMPAETQDYVQRVS